MDSAYELLARAAGITLFVLVLAHLGITLLGSARRTAYARSRHQLALERVQAEVSAVRLRLNVEAEHAKSWRGFRKFVVAHKVPEGADICSFYLRAHDNKSLVSFAPGQFLTLRVRMPGEPKATTRCYSLSCSPSHKDYYRITVKRIQMPGQPDGLMSSYLHDQVAEGSIIDVKAPNGNFSLDLAARRPIVLLAGGVGITPMLSMIEAVNDQGFPRDVWLFYGVRNTADHAFKKYFERLAAEQPNFHLVVCYGEPLETDLRGADYHHEGFISVDLMQQFLPSSNYEFYICGPPPMMSAMVSALDGWGVPQEDVRFEAFGPASVKRQSDVAAPADGQTTFKVQLQKSGRTIEWDSSRGSILDCAEAEGIPIDAGCRAGNCGTCMTALHSGAVSYLHDPGDTPDPGTCFVCVCVPTSDVVLDA